MKDYSILKTQISSLLDDVQYLQASLANIVALLYHEIEDVSWVGFYLLQNNELVLNVFQGLPACEAIALNCGVCGKAFSLDQTMNIPDVHQFKDHIACDSGSNSELVIPLHKENRVIGVLDIDSYSFNRFDAELVKTLEEIIKIIEEKLFSK